MTGKQNTVLWLGLALILVQFYIGGQFQLFFKGLTSSQGPRAPRVIISNSGTPNPRQPIFGPHGKKPL